VAGYRGADTLGDVRSRYRRASDTSIRGALFDAINAEALRCFLTEFPGDPLFVVLEWQHPGYIFDAEAHANAAEDAEWRVPVYPNGDYYIFGRDGFNEGTFGHPWERTLCVYGPRLVPHSAGLLRHGFPPSVPTASLSSRGRGPGSWPKTARIYFRSAEYCAHGCAASSAWRCATE
jgi:hypothetical protein